MFKLQIDPREPITKITEAHSDHRRRLLDAGVAANQDVYATTSASNSYHNPLSKTKVSNGTQLLRVCERGSDTAKENARYRSCCGVLGRELVNDSLSKGLF